MVEGVEDLGLHRVEVGEVVQGLQANVVQCSQRQWLQVQQFCEGKTGE